MSQLNLMPPCTGQTVTRVCSGRCQAQVSPLGAVNQAGCAPGAGRARTGPSSLAKHSARCASLPWRPVAPRQPLPGGHGFPRPAPPEGPGEGPCALLGRDGLPGPRFLGRPPRYGPSLQHPGGTGQGTGREGTGRISRCNSGFSRPAAARPQTLQRERCRRGAERGQPPFATGSPRAEATDEQNQRLLRLGAPSTGSAPRARRTAAHAGPAAPLDICFRPARAGLSQAPGHPTGVPDLHTLQQTPMSRTGKSG